MWYLYNLKKTAYTVAHNLMIHYHGQAAMEIRIGRKYVKMAYATCEESGEIILSEIQKNRLYETKLFADNFNL